MHVYKDSFFRIFQSDYRGALQRFFENRHVRITREIAAEFIDSATLDKLVALQLVEYDGDGGDYRLDDRIERFFDEMLGAVEVAQADWLVGLVEELRRLIEGHQKLADARKGEVLLRRICRLMRTCLSRIQRHLEDIKSAADYDYRAGSDYEIKGIPQPRIAGLRTRPKTHSSPWADRETRASYLNEFSGFGGCG